MVKLIVGLGNPGFRYRNTRHNIGFLVLKEIARKFKISIKKRRCKGISGEGSIDGEKIGLFMPQTYMNLSGEAVKEIVKKENIKMDDLLVMCDDINLKFGFMRFRNKGSGGGHNGLESIIDHLDNCEFPRLRIGIGKSCKIIDVVKFVLNPFDSEEKKQLKDIINRALECAITWVKEGSDRAMAKFNKRQSA